MIRSIRPLQIERDAPLPISRKKPWSGLTISVLMHGALVVAILLTIRSQAEKTAATSATAPAPAVDMVYIPQATRRPLPAPRREISRPDPNAIQATYTQRAMTTQTEDIPPAMKPAETVPQVSAPDPEPPAPVESAASPVPPAPTMESEAQRIFGRPLLRRQQEMTNQLGIRAGDVSDRDMIARSNCIPKPRDPQAPTEMATLIGRVYSGSNRPLSGAFLQIIGTSYSTYSDQTGLYKLVFDASLVDECRTQYVRVVADGYRGKNLVLGIGPGINDVLLSR
jgi:hypothetical protein